MKILIISNTYPNKSKPEAFVFVHNQARALHKNNNIVVVMDIDIRSIRWKRRLGIYKEIYDGIPIYRFSFPLITVKAQKLVEIVNKVVAKFLYKKIRKEYGNFDVIHAHFGLSSGCAGAAIKKRYNVPLVITEHYTGILSQENKKLKLAQKNYNYANKVIAVGQQLKDKIESMGIKNVYLIPNILDTNLFNYDDNKKTDKFTFLSIGHLIHRKGHHLTIEAFRNLKEKYKNIQLIIIGSGCEKNNLEKKVKQYNLNESITFIDRINNSELPIIYRKSNCFVLPSYLETFGVVFAEAIACGIPAIGTKCGGPEEFIDESNGIIINIDNVQELENAMEKMIHSAEKYNKIILHNRMESLCGENNIVNKLTKVYEEIIKTM